MWQYPEWSLYTVAPSSITVISETDCLPEAAASMESAGLRSLGFGSDKQRLDPCSPLLTS